MAIVAPQHHLSCASFGGPANGEFRTSVRKLLSNRGIVTIVPYGELGNHPSRYATCHKFNRGIRRLVRTVIFLDGFQPAQGLDCGYLVVGSSTKGGGGGTWRRKDEVLRLLTRKQVSGRKSTGRGKTNGRCPTGHWPLALTLAPFRRRNRRSSLASGQVKPSGGT